MRTKLGWVLVPALLLALCGQLQATAVNPSVFTDGIYTTYDYTLTSDEAADYVTAFHVYAPVALTLVTGWCESPDWTFDKLYDAEINAADLYWYLSNPNATGLASGDSMQFSIQTAASIPSTANYVIPEYLGNWGIETDMWAGFGVFVMMPSVPVPVGVPEPCSAAAVLAGVVAFGLTRRSRKHSF